MKKGATPPPNKNTDVTPPTIKAMVNLFYHIFYGIANKKEC